jgi:hypothetical protein
MNARRSTQVVAGIVAILATGTSCTENLPSGPNTFSARLTIVAPHDTTVVGDATNLTAQAIDADGHLIQNLKYTWASADTTVLGVATATTVPPATGDSAGQVKTFRGKHAGLTSVTLSLNDARFATSTIALNQAVVVGGVSVFSSHDTTLTAVNDTALAIGFGLIHVNGALTKSGGQGIRWTHLGVHTSLLGSGDTIRYIARSNGADTLIAIDDFCLAGAKCADTAIVRVAQQLTLTLSSKAFQTWSFADTVGPTVTLADRRGNGLAGTSVRLIPHTTADSVIVKVTPPFGTSNPFTGLIAAPQLVAAGNGLARVTVQGVGADGSIAATDEITVTVRQVARHVAVEPLRAVITVNDSIPIRPVARDARGAPIADATVLASSAGVNLDDVWAVAPPFVGFVTGATITASLTGVALPSENPGAPQLPVIVDQSQFTILQLDTATAGTTARTVAVTLLDSLGLPAIGRWLRFGAPLGPVPDSAQADVVGNVSTTWTPRDTSGTYTLTGVRGLPVPFASLADSAGRVVVRHTIVINPDIPSAAKSTLEISATTIAAGGSANVTITVRDKFGNIVRTAKATDVTVIPGAGGGTLSALSCVLGICTSVYTAPAAAGPDTISVQILGFDILLSPLAITIM